MKNKSGNKLLMLLTAFFGLAVLIVFPTNPLKAELAPGSVQFDKDFSQKIVPYILSQPVVAGPFTGGEEKDMDEILPFFTQPLTRYNLDLGSVPPKQSFKTGEMMNLAGSLSYSLDASASEKELNGLKGCKGCPVSETYHFPALSDVGVYAQVWRKDENKALSQKGDYLVDEFYVGEGFDLSDNVMKNFNLDWQIPEELKEGNYYLLLFVNSNKRFNLTGTPLVAFQQAGVYDFRVSNDGEGNGVELDKNSIKIGKQSYVYRQPAPEITPENGKITVAVPLSNLNPESQNVKINYNLYAWGQEDPTDLISSKQETETVDSGEKTNLEYEFSPSETGSVYNLEIKATTPTSVSTANVRFLVKDMNRGIFRFLGKTQNGQGEMLPVFCLRNAAWDNLFFGKVRISAYDKNDKVIKTFEKEGSMRPEDRCFVIKDSSWLKDSKVIKIQGEIFNENGNLVDKKIVSLVTKKGEKPSSANELNQNMLNNLPASKLQIILALLLIITLGIGGYLIFLRSKKEE